MSNTIINELKKTQTQSLSPLILQERCKAYFDLLPRSLFLSTKCILPQQIIYHPKLLPITKELLICMFETMQHHKRSALSKEEIKRRIGCSDELLQQAITNTKEMEFCVIEKLSPGGQYPDYLPNYTLDENTLPEANQKELVSIPYWDTDFRCLNKKNGHRYLRQQDQRVLYFFLQKQFRNLVFSKKTLYWTTYTYLSLKTEIPHERMISALKSLEDLNEVYKTYRQNESGAWNLYLSNKPIEGKEKKVPLFMTSSQKKSYEITKNYEPPLFKKEKEVPVVNISSTESIKKEKSRERPQPQPKLPPHFNWGRALRILTQDRKSAAFQTVNTTTRTLSELLGNLEKSIKNFEVF